MSEPIYFSTNSHPISNPTTQIMRVDLDGGFTVNESIPATDAAKMVLGLMKEEWLADAQATKIREQEDRIKRLEEAGDEMYKFINPPSPCMRTTRMDDLLQGWDDAKINTKEVKP